MATFEELQDQREDLVLDLACCERGAFPGSKESKKETACMMALKAFDEKHPEVIAAIKAERGW